MPRSTRAVLVRDPIWTESSRGITHKGDNCASQLYKEADGETHFATSDEGVEETHFASSPRFPATESSGNIGHYDLDGIRAEAPYSSPRRRRQITAVTRGAFRPGQVTGEDTSGKGHLSTSGAGRCATPSSCRSIRPKCVALRVPRPLGSAQERSRSDHQRTGWASRPWHRSSAAGPPPPLRPEGDQAPRARCMRSAALLQNLRAKAGGQQPHGHGHDVGFAAHTLGVGHLEAPCALDTCGRSRTKQASRRAVDHVDAARLERLRVCHRVVKAQPPSTPSTADTRRNSGLSLGHTARTASATSSGKRVRPAKSPPEASLRLLDSGDKN